MLYKRDSAFSNGEVWRTFWITKLHISEIIKITNYKATRVGISKDIKANKERKLYILSVLSWNRLSLSNEAETAFIDFRTKKKKNGIRTHAKYNTMTQKKKTFIYDKIANFKQRNTYLTRKSPKKTTTKANLNISSRNEWFWETRDMKNGTINEKWLNMRKIYWTQEY